MGAAAEHGPVTETFIIGWATGVLTMIFFFRLARAYWEWFYGRK